MRTPRPQHCWSRRALRGGVAVLAVMASMLAATEVRACLLDTECADGNLCNGVEICNLGTTLCEPGVPLPDGTPCDSGDTCSFLDSCQAGACVAGGGGDGDGDGVCNAEDNCVAVANSNQDDLDGDNAGDICDANDRELNLVVAKIMRNVSKIVGKPNGRIFMKGDFLTTSPEAAFNAASGFLVRIQDGPGASLLDTTFSWAPADCRTNSGGTIKCKSPSKTVQAVFTPIKGFPGAAYRFVMKMSKLALVGPFAEPVTVTVVNAPPVLVQGLDRLGVILDCRQINTGIVCREG